MGRLSFLFDDTVKSFLKLVGWILVPFVVALLGLALLTSLLTSFIWIALIVLIAYAYLRFNDKHNEHEEYDDHASQQAYNEGLHTYITLVEKQHGPKEDETKPKNH